MSDTEAVDDAVQATQESDATSPKETGTQNNDVMQARMEKLKALRRKLNESSTANRKDVAAEANKRRMTAQENARLERKRKQAEAFAEKIEAEETGDDLERKRAWEYTIADNEAWDKKLAKKSRRAQFEFTDYDDVARRKYKKDIDELKPDYKSYQAQREATLGIAPSAEGSSDLQSSSTEVATANSMLYRDANSFVYADHRPSEEAIDKVIHKLNMDHDKRNKFSRQRKQAEGDVTYINEKNKQFNKKLDRFFNQYTKEIRDNFERGTAL